MKTPDRSSTDELRIRDDVPFMEEVEIFVDDAPETFVHRAPSINAVSLTVQVEMQSPLFDYLQVAFRNDCDIFVRNDDYLGKKRVILRHVRRYKAVFTKWIFSFIKSVSTRRISEIRREI